MSYSTFKSGHIVINSARMTLKPQHRALCMSTCIYLQQVIAIVSQKYQRIQQIEANIRFLHLPVIAIWSPFFILYQIFRDARLTCRILRPKEDICIGIYVIKRLFTV